MATILAIESSCDETAVAILRGFDELLATTVLSQAGMHSQYGGVVPEVASRNHLATLPGLVRHALSEARISLDEVDVFAATAGPGLPTALLVGMAHAKALAIGCGRPFLAIDHVQGHMFSPFFGSGEIPPHIGLVVSGGHTLLVDVAAFDEVTLLGSTLDDAAGEAFDKVAKLLGLGYPGGIEIERLAREGDAARYEFPRSMLHSGDYRFSFSGLKTSVRYLLEREEVSREDVCASFQQAVIDVLTTKTIRAAKERGRSLIALSGGVSSNTSLQQCMRHAAEAEGIDLRVADPSLRTDNAAMIAYLAALRHAHGASDEMAADIFPSFDIARLRAEESVGHV